MCLQTVRLSPSLQQLRNTQVWDLCMIRESQLHSKPSSVGSQLGLTPWCGWCFDLSLRRLSVTDTVRAAVHYSTLFLSAHLCMSGIDSIGLKEGTIQKDLGSLPWFGQYIDLCVRRLSVTGTAPVPLHYSPVSCQHTSTCYKLTGLELKKGYAKLVWADYTAS